MLEQSGKWTTTKTGAPVSLWARKVAPRVLKHENVEAVSVGSRSRGRALILPEISCAMPAYGEIS